MNEHSIKDKLTKIQSLALRGEAGEQENAIALMERLMKEYDLSPEDLTDTKHLNVIRFPIADEFERRLLMQIYGKVVNTDKIQSKVKEGYLFVLLTRFQEEQMKDLFRIYSKAWQEESNMFFSAFIQKNELYPDLAPAPDNEDDYESLTKLVNMMRSVKKVNNPQRKNLLAKPLSKSL